MGRALRADREGSLPATAASGNCASASFTHSGSTIASGRAMRNPLFLAVVAALGACAACAGASSEPQGSSASAIDTTTDTPPGNFGEVTPGQIYRGREPSQEQIAWLRREHGIRTFVDLRLVERETPPGSDHEREQVEAAGATYVNIRITPWIVVDVDGIQKALDILDGKPVVLEDGAEPVTLPFPVYLHCLGGIDRTGVIVALHRVESEGWGPSCAYAEWTDYGYKGFGHTVVFRQFADYFEERTKKFAAGIGEPFALDKHRASSSCSAGLPW